MWGNQRGWIIAGIIGAGMLALLAYAIIPPGVTPPTNAPVVALAMQPANLPTDPDSVVPVPRSDCDAADHYRQASDDWAGNSVQYEAYQTNVTQADKNPPQAIKQIVAGVDCARMNLFSLKPDEVITYHADRPTLDALFAAGNLLNQLALLHTTDEYKKDELAQKYATAAFNLGRHLYQERICFMEWTDGVVLMEGAAGVLQRAAKDPEKAKALGDFAVACNSFEREKITPLWQILNGQDEQEKAMYAGDIFQIAQSSPDRMWRVEATLRLGRFKFNAATRGDQSGAKRVLVQMVASPSLSGDPLTESCVRTAAELASNLTILDYRQI